MEVGLALLSHSSVPLRFWDHAFQTLTFDKYHLPSRVIDFDTPLECLLGAQPDYTMLKTFDCACWPNLRPYNTRKLQFRSQQCIFLGYNNLHKGYKCLYR